LGERRRSRRGLIITRMKRGRGAGGKDGGTDGEEEGVNTGCSLIEPSAALHSVVLL